MAVGKDGATDSANCDNIPTRELHRLDRRPQRQHSPLKSKGVALMEEVSQGSLGRHYCRLKSWHLLK